MDATRTSPPTQVTIMRAWKPQWAMPLVLLACSLVGCQHTSSYPSDPVLVSKKPINAKPELKPPAIMTYAEPDAPAGPVSAVASGPRLELTPTTSVTAARPTVRGQAMLTARPVTD
jgi:hypothetical protein